MKRIVALFLVLTLAFSCSKQDNRVHSKRTHRDIPVITEIPPSPDEPRDLDMVKTPLTIRTRCENTTFHFFSQLSGLTVWTWSIDGGVTWNELDWQYDSSNYLYVAEFILPNAGTKLLLKGNSGTTKGCQINFDKSAFVYGNVMSLIYWDDFESRTTLTESYCFEELFFYCEQLVNHPFYDIVLPATQLTEGAYSAMFEYCESMERAPDLPATNAPSKCYESMFEGCKSLVKVPSVLSAESLGTRSYADMFYGCSSLKEAPEIKAKSLSMASLLGMFGYCELLEIAPAINVSYIPNDGMYFMFLGCTNLKYIECMATSFGNSYSTKMFTKNAGQGKGTFVKAASMTSWPIGEDGIPVGWTVVNK